MVPKCSSLARTCCLVIRWRDGQDTITAHGPSVSSLVAAAAVVEFSSDASMAMQASSVNSPSDGAFLKSNGVLLGRRAAGEASLERGGGDKEMSSSDSSSDVEDMMDLSDSSSSYRPRFLIGTAGAISISSSSSEVSSELHKSMKRDMCVCVCVCYSVCCNDCCVYIRFQVFFWDVASLLRVLCVTVFDICDVLVLSYVRFCTKVLH
mmetsp:Transcript_29341/g.43243  ORF Transcript_29341/g.43243 Transcript_29341/m.43243 type:complete len:207 (+) Transcript_29341:257-877(+)